MSASPTAETPTPLSIRSGALANAYEALLQAKAMLRGEQSPFTTPHRDGSSSPGASPSFTFTDTGLSANSGALRATLAQQNSASGMTAALYPCGDGRLVAPNGERSESSSNGATQSGSRSGPNVSTTQSLTPGCQDDAQRLERVPQSTSASPPMKEEAALDDSPDVQPPALAPARHAAAPASPRRGSLHVQFDVRPVPDAAESHAEPQRASWSPQPVPPTAHLRDRTPRSFSEVDVCTVDLLQCLSYAELQLIRESLTQQEQRVWEEGRGAASMAFHGVDSAAHEKGGTMNSESTKQKTGFTWEVEPPVMLDADAQLRYAEFFYTQFLRDEGSGNSETCEETSIETAKECASNASLPFAKASTADGDRVVAVGRETVTEPRIPHLAAGSEDDELTLSPISAVSLSNSPAHHCHAHERESSSDGFTLKPDAATRHYSPSPSPPPPAGPSILISPQRPHYRSPSAPRPRITLVEPDGVQHEQQQQRRPRSRCTASPSMSPAERSLGLSVSSPSRSTSLSWSLRDFDVGRRLGSGASGRTYLTREKQSKAVVALKCVQKAALASWTDEDSEVSRIATRAARLHMTAGRHCPQVLRLYTFFEDAERVYLTLEYAEDGDLASYAACQPHGRMQEREVQQVVHQLTLALTYLHEHQIVHGGVAPRHVLLKEKHSMVKLGNFSRAKRLRSVSVDEECWATEEEAVDYAAPEVVRHRERSCKSDMWALGVLTYELLCGYLPFEHVRTSQAKQLICTGVVYYPTWWSATAKSFVGSLLRVDEAERCGAADALHHPFLASLGDATQAAAAHFHRPGTTGEARKLNLNSTTPALFPAEDTRPIHGSIFNTLSQSSERSPRNDTCTNESAASPFGAASATSFIPLAGCTSTIESLTMSTSSSSRRGDTQNHSASADNEDDSGSLHRSSTTPNDGEVSESASTVSNVPVANAAATTSSSSPVSFLNFALPSHSWRSTTQPYGGTVNCAGTLNGGLPSVVVTSPLSASSAVHDEAGVRLQRRSSATSMKSLALSSRPSLTTTLSDVSASFLSTTCAPTGAPAVLIGLDGPNSGSKIGNSINSNHHYFSSHNNSSSHHHSGSRLSPAVSLSSYFANSGEAQVPCSVTVSSLTAASPHPPSEWTSALDVDVSATSSDHSPRVSLTRHASSPLLSAVTAAARQTKDTKAGEERQRPRSQLALAPVVGFYTALSSTAGAEKGRKKKTSSRQVASGPDCAMRLDFDCLSDDEW